MPSHSLRHLRIAAHIELISLIVMLANVFTVHLKSISSLMGPAHGCAYLFVVIATVRLKQASTAAKMLALIPGIGGLLALRKLDRFRPAPARTEEVLPS
ncbi:hypothetical protein JO861_19135 [Rhodococcus hoagii]|uniref:hypothetical protein n=1 Tax=Rhodococcus hoagii TaxID=43767 RepID=UPI00196647A2|nr:hypothetical protein [Prescottella equi]MBM9838666.1 hypothetical protein [Prescottella equi]NKR65235.1 DUF3817 domain-containing protein [Prescottella equi]NKS99511.1 DUF3817 domain-containing protein [Prescottella equi]